MESYLEYYQYNIAPKLKEIDIFLKCEEEFTIENVSKYLDIDYDETRHIIREKEIQVLNRGAFFKIMEYGSSEICRLYARELQCGSPHVYTREDVAYIYDINIELIHKACDRLNYNSLTNYSLPSLFTNIPIGQVKIHN